MNSYSVDTCIIFFSITKTLLLLVAFWEKVKDAYLWLAICHFFLLRPILQLTRVPKCGDQVYITIGLNSIIFKIIILASENVLAVIIFCKIIAAKLEKHYIDT